MIRCEAEIAICIFGTQHKGESNKIISSKETEIYYNCVHLYNIYVPLPSIGGK
jgi:hypothetical protein